VLSLIWVAGEEEGGGNVRDAIVQCSPRRIKSSLSKGLRVLFLQGIQLEDEAAVELLWEMKELRRLDFHNCTLLTERVLEEAFIVFSKGCHLRQLQLSNCGFDKSLGIQLADLCKSLNVDLKL
jgi:hypothetical protein